MERCLRPLLIILHLALAVQSCATSSIQTGDAKAEVFLDGQYQGQGVTVMVNGFGRGKAVTIEVANSGGRKSFEVERAFTFRTLLICVYTYGVGCFLFWELPPNIDARGYIEIEKPASWQSPAENNLWLKPISKQTQ